jgi:hypothetical protein
MQARLRLTLLEYLRLYLLLTSTQVKHRAYFNFSITANGGRNIFWSILRDGSNTPLYSGNSLPTVNGSIYYWERSTTLNHFITEQDFLKKKVKIFLLL